MKEQCLLKKDCQQPFPLVPKLLLTAFAQLVRLQRSLNLQTMCSCQTRKHECKTQKLWGVKSVFWMQESTHAEQHIHKWVQTSSICPCCCCYLYLPNAICVSFFSVLCQKHSEQLQRMRSSNQMCFSVLFAVVLIVCRSLNAQVIVIFAVIILIGKCNGGVILDSTPHFTMPLHKTVPIFLLHLSVVQLQEPPEGSSFVTACLIQCHLLLMLLLIRQLMVLTFFSCHGAICWTFKNTMPLSC